MCLDRKCTLLKHVLEQISINIITSATFECLKSVDDNIYYNITDIKGIINSQIRKVKTIENMTPF